MSASMVHKGREEPWPFIIPLPTKSTAQYRILTSVFSSDIAMKILRRLKLNAKTYQRDLVAELKAHSNKSILKYLKMFVEAGILEEGMERVTEDGRSMWIKWYMPTFMGKWLILLLTPRDRLSPEEIDSFFDDLQLILLENDVAYDVTERIREMLKERLKDVEIPRFGDAGKVVREALYSVLDMILSEAGSLDLLEYVESIDKKPFTVLFLGVNGVGKTTTIAKLSYLFKNKGFKVILACADTFRAGAIEQLKIHLSLIHI